uniref:Uncharacterized protein n=1 Tax=Culex tarsalis TaxID=7177 RepID=A0A1Q3FT19_CULTA
MDTTEDQPTPDNPGQDHTLDTSQHDASAADPPTTTDTASSQDKSGPGTPVPKPSSRKSSILSALRDKTSRNSSNLDTSAQNKSGAGSPVLEPSSRNASNLGTGIPANETTSRNASNLEAPIKDKSGSGSPVQEAGSRVASKIDDSTQGKTSQEQVYETSSRHTSKLGSSIQNKTVEDSSILDQDTSIRDTTQDVSASQGTRTPDKTSRNASIHSVPKSQLSVQETPAPTDTAAPKVRVTAATPTVSHLSLEPTSSDISTWDLTAYQFNCPLLPQDIEKDYNELGSIQLPEYYQLVDHTLATVFKCFRNGRRDVHKLQPDQILWALKMIEAHQVAERDLASENVRLLKQFLGEIVISMCAGGIPEKRQITELPRPEGLEDDLAEESFSLGRLPVGKRRDMTELPSKTIPPAAASTPMPPLEDTLNATASSELDDPIATSTPPPRSETSVGTRTPPLESSTPLHTSTPIKLKRATSILDLREGLRQINVLFSQYKTSRLERNEGDKLNLLAIERLLIEMGANCGPSTAYLEN